jgi:hypothetical protein
MDSQAHFITIFNRKQCAKQPPGNSQYILKSVNILKDFYHEAHEDHEESVGYKESL